MENTMENIEEKPAIDKFFDILNSQFTKRPMHFDRTAIEAILRMRGRLITEAEKETDSTNKELMIKEIERIDDNIYKYKTKRIQYHMKIDPELKGYEPYKSNDEQQKLELPKWKNGNTGIFYIELYELTNKHIQKNETLSVNKAVIEVYNKHKATIFKDINYGKGWDEDSLNGYYYKGKNLKTNSK